MEPFLPENTITHLLTLRSRISSAKQRSGIVRSSLVHSHWSRNVEAWLSLVESFIVLKYFHGVAPPALLCHKEPARRIQSPLLGAYLGLWTPMQWGYFAYSSLVLYGIRDRWLPCTERSYYGAPLCHKEPAWDKKEKGLWMPELVLYDIRELRPAIPGF